MFTRREFVQGSLAAGAALGAPAAHPASAQEAGPAAGLAAGLERNKAAVRRFKEAQGSKDEEAIIRDVLAPGYKRWRGGV
ncbi:MAG TPA: twin-arginine translocation signal domain-containing protein, partial [Xanthobacteraceae bacterium]|nr:twin-arginine translocation signal domain-containing protein [Xanthobacteraceae bacterium]